MAATMAAAMAMAPEPGLIVVLDVSGGSTAHVTPFMSASVPSRVRRPRAVATCGPGR
ncbi:hypothetical protein ACFCYC_23630 [Streptomyces sp. NPDC056402]|uniref:hypothetical protein n=1 Tax=Streptomyces sp. NPDC056402 TaxID=3345810 RepID=UPI0035E30EA6